MNNIMCMSSDWLEFIPGIGVSNGNPEHIYVFTKRKPNTFEEYKRKRFPLGFIYYHKKMKKYIFSPRPDTGFGKDTLSKIVAFISSLDSGYYVFDKDRGIIK